MPALIAVDPREAVLRVAAGEEPFDDIDFDAPPEPATSLQLGRMPGGALIQRRRARFARPVHPASGSLRRMRAPLHATSNAFHSREGARRSQPLPRGFVSRRKYADRGGDFVTNCEGAESLREGMVLTP